MDSLKDGLWAALVWLGDQIKRAFAALRVWAGQLAGWAWGRGKEVSGQTWRLVGIGAVVFLFLYYPLGMAFMHEIGDDPNFDRLKIEGPPEASRSVAVVMALIDREINENGWVMNDPFFKPSSLLDNMPNFQQGMFSSFSRFAIELRDQLGRQRGSSAADPDLETAAGLLPYPGDVWIFNFSVSLLPTASAERQYLRAMEALANYNQRLASGSAVFERRSDNLLATLDRMALDLGSSSAAIDQHVKAHSDDLWDTEGDDLFYNVKGQAYGYLMILKAMRQDFSGVISDRDLEAIWDQMLDSFLALVRLDPVVVTNGAVDDMMLANHLLAQGFYLMRARTQLREITSILQK
ncbi:MAG: DUF2333 family protein [Sphingomonadales bacterium]